VNGQCLVVYDESFYCFHCHVGGDVIAYEQDRLGCDFNDAVRSLADTYNIPLIEGEALSEEEKQAREQAKARLNTIAGLLNAAAAFYHSNLGKHREYFRERGFTDETIDKHKLGFALGGTKLLKHLRQFCTDENVLLGTGLFFKDDHGALKESFYNRYMFPYVCNNQGDVSYLIGRDATGKAKAKYKKLRERDTDPSVEHILWNAWQVRDNEKPIVVCEGIVDAMLCEQEFGDWYYVISPVTTRINKHDVERISDVLSQRHHRVIIVNDNEANHAGLQGALDSALKVAGAVKVQLQNSLSSQSEIKDRMPDIRIATLRKPPYREKVDCADYIQCGRVKELAYWIEAARPPQAVLKYIKNDPLRFFDIPSKERGYRTKYLVDEIRQEGRYFLTAGDTLHCYSHVNGGGYYKECERDMKVLASEKLGIYSGRERVNEAIWSLALDESVDDTQPPKLVNLKNGVLDVDNLKLRKSSVDDLYLYQIPVEWSLDARCPKFDKFLSEVSAGNETLIYEMIGYAMQSRCNMQKCFILLGKGRNGKSVLLDVITRILGKKNVASVDPQDLTDDPYGAVQLYRKLACINADIPSTGFASSNLLKKITDGSSIRGREIYKKGFDFSPYATLIFSGNEMPRSYDRTYAYYRRFVIVPFTRIFPEGDGSRDFDEMVNDLLTEKEAIINNALCLYKLAEKRGRFSETEQTAEAKAQYQLDNEPIREFISQCITAQPGAYVKATEMSNAYKEWCEENGYKRAKIKDLIASLSSVFGDAYEYGTKAVGSDRKKSHLGVCLIEE